MKSLRIYLPEARKNDQSVREALGRVVAGGATLYQGTGFWSGGADDLSMEKVIVVEVLDCDAVRQEHVDRLARALLDSGEETVLVASQETSTRFLVRDGSVPEKVQL